MNELTEELRDVSGLYCEDVRPYLPEDDRVSWVYVLSSFHPIAL